MLAVRTDPPDPGPEADQLAFLDFQRETVLVTCGGLSAERLGRAAETGSSGRRRRIPTSSAGATGPPASAAARWCAGDVDRESVAVSRRTGDHVDLPREAVDGMVGE